MFDFRFWCAWAEARCHEANPDRVRMMFGLNRAIEGGGASVTFKIGRKLMKFSFSESGESSFYGVDLASGRDIDGFYIRRLTDETFERCFNDCVEEIS